LKTPKLESLEEFATRVERARDYAAEIGRTAPFDICFAPLTLTSLGRGGDRSRVRDEIAAFAATGVTMVPVEVHARTRREWMAEAERLAYDLMV
jgi:hypothetical protein